MSRTVIVVREMTVSDGSTNRTVTDRRVIPYEAIRCFTINPIIEAFTPHTFTAASLTAIAAQGVPSGTVAKIATIQDQTFLGEPATIAALRAASVTQNELDDYGGIFFELVVKGADVERLMQIVAYLELVSAPPSASGNIPRSPLSAAIVPVAALTDFSQLTAFYDAMQEIQDDLMNAALATVDIEYQDDFP